MLEQCVTAAVCVECTLPSKTPPSIRQFTPVGSHASLNTGDLQSHQQQYSLCD